jgi:hypothetical protein
LPATVRESNALAEALPRVAVMVADREEVNARAFASNVAVAEDAGTVTEDGTVRDRLSSAIFTARLVAVAELNVTVQAALAPETTEAGLHTRDVRVTAGVRLSEATLELPLADAVTLAVSETVTVPALALHVPCVAPAGTVMEAGTVRALLSSEIATAKPPEGAAALRVTVHVAVPPEATEVGLQTRAEGTMGAMRLSEA